MNVGPSEDWGVLSPTLDQRVYDPYVGCVIPFHECPLSLIGYRIPFNEFEISVLNYLLVVSFTIPSYELM